jgi:hypothetical protein
MAWDPQLNVIDLTPVIDNLLGYIRDNQSDALFWANGGAGLDDFQGIYPNASGWLSSLYPYVLVLVQEDEGETEGDTLLSTTLRLRLEVAVTGTKDDLSGKAKRYDMALRSMLINIPGDTLTADMKTNTVLWKQEWPKTVYDVTSRDKKTNAFVQMFQTEMTYIFQTNLVDN